MNSLRAAWTFTWILLTFGGVISDTINYSGRAALLAYSPARGEFPVQSLFGRGYYSYLDESGLTRIITLEPNPLLGVRVGPGGHPQIDIGRNIDFEIAPKEGANKRKPEKLKPIKEFDEHPFMDTLNESNASPSVDNTKVNIGCFISSLLDSNLEVKDSIPESGIKQQEQSSPIGSVVPLSPSGRVPAETRQFFASGPPENQHFPNPSIPTTPKPMKLSTFVESGIIYPDTPLALELDHILSSSPAPPTTTSTTESSSGSFSGGSSFLSSSSSTNSGQVLNDPLQLALNEILGKPGTQVTPAASGSSVGQATSTNSGQILNDPLQSVLDEILGKPGTQVASSADGTSTSSGQVSNPNDPLQSALDEILGTTNSQGASNSAVASGTTYDNIFSYSEAVSSASGLQSISSGNLGSFPNVEQSSTFQDPSLPSSVEQILLSTIPPRLPGSESIASTPGSSGGQLAGGNPFLPAAAPSPTQAPFTIFPNPGLSLTGFENVPLSPQPGRNPFLSSISTTTSRSSTVFPDPSSLSSPGQIFPNQPTQQAESGLLPGQLIPNPTQSLPESGVFQNPRLPIGLAQLFPSLSPQPSSQPPTTARPTNRPQFEAGNPFLPGGAVSPISRPTTIFQNPRPPISLGQLFPSLPLQQPGSEVFPNPRPPTTTRRPQFGAGNPFLPSPTNPGQFVGNRPWQSVGAFLNPRPTVRPQFSGTGNPFLPNFGRIGIQPDTPLIQPLEVQSTQSNSSSFSSTNSADISQAPLPEQIKDTPEVAQAKREHFLAHELALAKLEMARQQDIDNKDHGSESSSSSSSSPSPSSSSAFPSDSSLIYSAPSQDVISATSTVANADQTNLTGAESDAVPQVV